MSTTKWEQHLTDAQRYQLAWNRSVAAEDDEVEGVFFVELQANREGWEFLDALDEAGDDPVAQAKAFYHLHLDSYPFWLGEAREAEEGEAEPFKPLV
jgi:hypothetical protein